MNLLAQLMGEEAVLFKEKVNYKLPGGAGFTAHQDAPAFLSFGQRFHITVLITVDNSTQANGGLEFSEPVPMYETLKQAEDGTVHPEVESEISWEPVDLPAGSLVFFDSYIPHRSPSNQSQDARRALYITYNRLSEGSRRDDYYRDKREKFPPEIEREEGRDYSIGSQVYNLGNPIR
jgi:ectoine hydroxylase-related dioxygenase (phytanoyl-CoA dioxygenase family)